MSVFVPFVPVTLMFVLIMPSVFIAFTPFTFFLLLMELLRNLKEVVERLRGAIGVVIGIAIIGAGIRIRARIIIRLSNSFTCPQITIATPAATHQDYNNSHCYEHFFHRIILDNNGTGFSDAC
jgi:hypothetical protein